LPINDEDVIPVGGLKMRKAVMVSVIATIRPDKLFVKAIKKLKDYNAIIIEANEEIRVVKFALALKFYPFIAEFLEEYSSTSQYQVLTFISHGYTAAKLKEFYIEAKEPFKLWLIPPPNSYIRIIGLVKTKHNNVMVEFYPRRSRKKGLLYLRYIGEKGENVYSYTMLTQTLAYVMFKDKDEFYEYIEKASKALSEAERFIRNTLKKLSTR